MHTLKVTLKQHTPLIHFQHDQEGATLRASEVKPKLDKFILKRLSQEERTKGEKEGWIKVKEGKAWLDYKMRIETEGRDNRQEFLLASYMNQERKNSLKRSGITVVDNTPFFAQEKQNGEVARSIQNHSEQKRWNEIEKKGILHRVNLILTVICINEDLVGELLKSVQAFFLVYNFGTRQSKGFGSFSVIGLVFDEQPQSLKDNSTLLCDNFLFVYRKTIPNPTVALLFSTINEDYRLLKSGRRRPYAKSKLMLYEKRHNVRWEKKFIKQDFNDNPILNANEEEYILKSDHDLEYESENVDFRYVRIVLGLAEQYEFLLENPPQKNSKMIVKIANADIDRYQSPLLFKVIDNDVFLVGNSVDSNILNRQFDFSISIQDDEVAWFGSIGILKTANDFSLQDFMRFAMNDNTNSASLNYQTIKQ